MSVLVSPAVLGAEKEHLAHLQNSFNLSTGEKPDLGQVPLINRAWQQVPLKDPALSCHPADCFLQKHTQEQLHHSLHLRQYTVSELRPSGPDQPLAMQLWKRSAPPHEQECRQADPNLTSAVSAPD